MGWLKDILTENRRTVASWPGWKRRAGMIDDNTFMKSHTDLRAENAQLKAELAQATQQVKKGQP